MRGNSILAGGIAAAMLALASGSASAQVTPQTPVTTPVNPGFFFWSIGASGGIRNLPNWSYGQVISPGGLSKGFSYDPSLAGGGPEFVVGYALNRASALGRVGDVPRIELGLTTFFGQSTQSSTIGGPGTLTFIPGVDGSGLLLSPGGPFKAKLESTAYTGEAALRFKTSFKTSPRFQIIPSVAAIGGMAFYRYRLETNVVDDDFEGVALGVKETIRSWHVGGEAALQIKWQINRSWSLNGGASVAAMYRRSDFRGLTQASDSFGQFVEVNASDNQNKFAWRLGVNLGITYDWGWARLSLSGFGYWDSAVPGINNPEINAGSATVSTARLTHDGEWAYGGRIALVFPIFMGR